MFLCRTYTCINACTLRKLGGTSSVLVSFSVPDDYEKITGPTARWALVAVRHSAISLHTLCPLPFFLSNVCELQIVRSWFSVVIFCRMKWENTTLCVCGVTCLVVWLMYGAKLSAPPRRICTRLADEQTEFCPFRQRFMSCPSKWLLANAISAPSRVTFLKDSPKLI